jgi:hypothetical protein
MDITKEQLKDIRKNLIDEILRLCENLNESKYNSDSICYVNWVKYINKDGTLSVRGDSPQNLSPYDIWDCPTDSLFDILEILKK